MARPGTSLALAALFVAACGTSHGPSGEGDAGGGSPDASVRRDAGPPPLDAGHDAGSPDHWSACTDNSECTVAPASCCGACGTATPDDMVGVNRARLGEQRGEACADGVACPACVGMQSPYLVATCEMSTCRALDLRSDPATACSDDSDCFLWVAACIDCGEIPESEVIAVSDNARVSDLLCDEGFVPPPCAPVLPDYLEPVCTAGRCEVHDPRE